MSKNYVELKVSDLRDECKNRGLDTTGLKVHLVERLNKFDREQLIKNKTEVKHTLVSTDDKVDSKDKPDTNQETVNPTPIESNTNKSAPKEDRKRPHQQEVSNVTESKKENIINLASSESDNWENRTDVHLDFYNSDMNLVLDTGGYSGTPLYENGFEYMCGGVKGNYGFKSGKVFFEVKILKKLKVELNNDAGESHFIRVGWSTDNESLALGEGVLSFGYDGAGKKVSDNNFGDYGIKITDGNVIGCFLEFNADCFVIRYSVDGISQGEAFKVLSRELKDHVLIPHIYTKNISFEVNFGQNDKSPLFQPKTETQESQPIADQTWNLVARVNLNQRSRALMPPKSKSECEVLMMCGLPGCGKTNWTEKQTKEHLEKRFNVLSVNTVLEKMKVINLRNKVSNSSWDSFISFATHSLNKLMEIAVSRRRNFILDQTNVYPSAQRRRMKPFEEFIRKAIIIVPTDDEYQRRMNQVIQEEGKDVPESAVLQLKENFVIPEENSDLFNEIIFIELQRSEAEELIKKYNEEAKNLKKKDAANADAKSKREVDDESFGKWANSPKDTTEDSEPTAPKKSRWNDQIESSRKSESKTRESRHERASPERLPRKNDYKEASDSGKGGGGSGNRSNESGFRSDDRYNSKFRDQRGGGGSGGSDRSGNRSTGGSTMQNRKSDDRKPPRFDSNSSSRDDSKFSSRNTMGGSGNRDSRPRDRGTESRGGTQFQSSSSRDNRPPRGGYNERRPTNNNNSSYDSGSNSNKFSQAVSSAYNDRSGGMNSSPGYGHQDSSRGGNSGSRFSQNVPERNDFRGGSRGRGGASNPSFGGSDNSNREGSSDRRAAPDSRSYPNYSEYSPYNQQQDISSGRQQQAGNARWQSPSLPDYKGNSEPIDSGSRRTGPAISFDGAPLGNRAGGYEHQHQPPPQQQQQHYGGPRGAVGMPLTRATSNDKMMSVQQHGQQQSSYGDRKLSSGVGANAPARGAPISRGGRAIGGPPLMNTPPQIDDYSYGSSSGYDKSFDKGYEKSFDKGYDKGYDAPISKFGPKPTTPYGGGTANSGMPTQRPTSDAMSYSSAKGAPMRTGAGGGQGYSSKGAENTGRGDYASSGQMMQQQPASGGAYDNYQSSYDSASYSQHSAGGGGNNNSNSGYYNYYTGDSGNTGIKESPTYHQSQTAMAPVVGSTNRSSSGGTASTYQQQQQSMYQSSSGTGGGYHQQSSASTGAYASSNNPSSGGYQSSGSYQSSNYPTGGGGGYQQQQQSSYLQGTGGGSGGGYQQSTNYGSSNNASNATAYHNQQQPQQQQQSSYQSANTAGSYTNPYNAIYENTSAYNSSYYGQTNTYAQSGTYGDNTVNSQKFPDYNSSTGGNTQSKSMMATDRAIPPAAVAANLTASSASGASVVTGGGQQAAANWNSGGATAGGYGDYSQYYGQYYGNN